MQIAKKKNPPATKLILKTNPGEIFEQKPLPAAIVPRTRKTGREFFWFQHYIYCRCISRLLFVFFWSFFLKQERLIRKGGSQQFLEQGVAKDCI